MCNIFVDDKNVGYCKYSVVDNDVQFAYIEYISIKPFHKRKGYATEMVMELKSKYELRWNLQFTQDGRQWYHGLVNKKII